MLPNRFSWLGTVTVHMLYMCFLFFMTHTYGTHKDFFFILALSNEPACALPTEMWAEDFACDPVRGPLKAQLESMVQLSVGLGLCSLHNSETLYFVSLLSFLFSRFPASPFLSGCLLLMSEATPGWNCGKAFGGRKKWKQLTKMTFITCGHKHIHHRGVLLGFRGTGGFSLLKKTWNKDDS